MKIKIGDCVYIEWQDTSTLHGWYIQKEGKRWADEGGWPIHEIGFVVEVNKKYLLLASSYSPEDWWQDKKYGELTKIPRYWVNKYKIVKGVK